MASLESTIMLQRSDYERITLLNRTESPLLRLPAELRNHIYTFEFSNQVDKFAANVPQQLFRSRYAHIIGPAALLLTSRQTYAETNVLFFKTSTFDLQRIYWRKHALKAKNIAAVTPLSQFCWRSLT